MCRPLSTRGGEGVVLLSLPRSRLPPGLGIKGSGQTRVDFVTGPGAAHRPAAREPAWTEC